MSKPKNKNQVEQPQVEQPQVEQPQSTIPGNTPVPPADADAAAPVGTEEEMEGEPGEGINLSLESAARDYFKEHPECDELYATSDGELFFEKYKAEAHAWNLNEAARKVVRFERDADEAE